jgi:hypothetical protein
MKSTETNLQAGEYVGDVGAANFRTLILLSSDDTEAYSIWGRMGRMGRWENTLAMMEIFGRGLQ